MSEEEYNNSDVYKEKNVEDELEDDEIEEYEAGFMEGYDRERDSEWDKEEE